MHAGRAKVDSFHLHGKDQSTSDTANSAVTLQSLKYKEEPLHMAKVAEGRNVVVDERGGHRRVLPSPTNAKETSTNTSPGGLNVKVWEESGAAASKEEEKQGSPSKESKGKLVSVIAVIIFSPISYLQAYFIINLRRFISSI